MADHDVQVNKEKYVVKTETWYLLQGKWEIKGQDIQSVRSSS